MSSHLDFGNDNDPDEHPDPNWRTRCNVCGKELTWDKAYYTNDQNLFEGRFVCFECGE